MRISIYCTYENTKPIVTTDFAADFILIWDDSVNCISICDSVTKGFKAIRWRFLVRI